MLDIFLNRPTEFPCLTNARRFPYGKVFSSLEDGLVETGIFGQKVIESVISATDYTRSLKGVLIIESVIEFIKWDAFWSEAKKDCFKEVISNVEVLKEAMRNKDAFNTQKQFKSCESKSVVLRNEFEKFSKTSHENSEMSQYTGTLL